MKNENAVDH
jgi:hypothetical protein